MNKNHALSLAATLLAATWALSSGGQPLGGPGNRVSTGLEAQGSGQRGGPPEGGRGLPGMPQLTQEQQAAVRALDQASATQDRAVTEARRALNAAIFSERPDTVDIKAKADKLAAAELTRATVRAEAFAKLQSSPNKLNLPAPALTMLMDMGERGAPGGIGGEVQGSSELPFVNPLFGDNMVLQRGKPNTIWGWSKPGEEIRVTVANHTVKTLTRNDSRWSVVIEPPAPGGPYTVVIDGPQHVEFHDVLVGDVWLCGGQSNMEMGLSRVRNGNDEIAAADHTRIRLFVVRQRGAKVSAAYRKGHGRFAHRKPSARGVGAVFRRRLTFLVAVCSRTLMCPSGWWKIAAGARRPKHGPVPRHSARSGLVTLEVGPTRPSFSTTA